MNKLTKREWIKNIAIVFLVIMLILTFFSKTIMNRTLPEVSTQNVTSGAVVTQVRGEGAVVAEDPYNLVVEETRKIASVVKHEGDRVEIGDVIYKLEGESSDELTNAKNEYESMKNAYEIGLIDTGLTPSEVATIESGVTPTSSAILQQLTNKDNAITAAEKQVAEAEKKVADLEKQKALATDATVDTTNEEKAVANAQSELEKAEEVINAHNANKGVIEAYNNAVADRDYYASLLVNKTGDSDDIRLKMTIINPITNMEEPNPDYNSNISYDPNYDYYADKVNALAIDINEMEREKNTALTKVLSDEELKKAQDNVNNKKAALDTAKKNLLNKQDSGNNNTSNITRQLVEAESDLANKQAVVENLKKDRETYFNKEKTKLEIEKQYQELVKKQNQIKDLEAKAIGGTVTSPVAGTISSVSYTAGEKIEAGSTAAVIQLDGKGYTLSFPVTDKQARSVKVGDEVSVVDSWFYSDINANLVAIQPDKSSQRDGKLLVFSITGSSVQAGQRLTLSVGQKSSNYDLIVPINAVREDNKGSFVLIMDTKQTPFGSRYVAKRVDVEILAKDDKNVAVRAELNGWEYVITNSSKPLQNKDQVKLAE